MSAVDEVAALPGGAAVTELIKQVDSANPQALTDLLGGWRKTSTGLTDASGALTRLSADQESVLKGEFADKWRDYLGSTSKASLTLSQSLQEAQGVLAQTAAVLEGARNWAKSRCEWLLSTAKAIPAGNGRDAAIKTLCDETAVEVKQVLATYSAQLKIALDVLRRIAGQSKPFSSLKLPGMPIPLQRKVVMPQDQKSALIPGTTGGVVGGKLGNVVNKQATPPSAPAPAPAPPPGKPVQHKPVTSTDGPPGGGGSGGGSGGSGGSHGSGGSGGSGGSSGAPSGMPSGQVGDWIREALEVLRQNGVNVDNINPADLMQMIQHESSGNPHAVNGWDSNAAAGTPSKGLMQTIDPTFNAYKVPGHDDIWNPVDNIVAAVRYAIARYGSISNVPGVVQVHNGGSYVGY
ncbi:transglycosylase SLT domain-containing protein [Amycolatopsis jejuensis]|uniref:transglycosylase SLT domain-containing protein n=1 Tax=Amycolatopsis jejuensis TaxID=330084 RepID=UPI000690C5D2|nr:transglycosylase SLT domain-containing protein [Amycolatopsis jejuensis]